MKTVFLSLMMGLCACQLKSQGSMPPANEPFVEGFITHVNIAGDLREIRVEEDSTSLQGMKAFVRVPGATPLWRRVGERVERARPDELVVGKRVRVWADGPVAQSYPVQARASAVVIEAE